MAAKFFIFTATLLFWMLLMLLGFDLHKGNVDWVKWAVVGVLTTLVAAGLSRFTTKILARPLALLEEGIHSVIEGRPEHIGVSRTRDEIEFLGHSFNSMIERLNATQNEVRQHQELLEERIRQRTEQLEQAMFSAQAASQAKSEFLANMSHELRTPMNGVLGMIDIVMDSALTADQREQLETAQRCANSLLAILNDVLDLSKIEAGKMILERIPFDLRVLVDDTIRAHRPKASRKGITINFKASADVPRKITGDPLRIRQMVSNLIGNAVKFTEKGTVRVELTRTGADDGHRLSIQVVDTGVGIPADKLSCIFEKFTQADGSISRKYGGTGLGLAITKKLVEMHDGIIQVTSVAGKGSAFSLLFPAGVCLAESVGEVEVQQPEMHSDGNDERQTAPSILVVEDNHVNQKVVTAILRKRGYHVDVADHGRQALEYLELLAYQLVLMDVQMPVMDGLETTSAIRRDPRFQHLPIVAMTAHAMSGDRERCLAAGMNDYIAKPLNPTALIGVVEEYVRNGRTSASTDLPAAILTGGDKGLLLEMHRIFVQLIPERLEMLRQCVHKRDFTSLEREAIRLANSATQIAIAPVTEAARNLARAAREQSADAALLRLAEVENEVTIAAETLTRTEVSAS